MNRNLIFSLSIALFLALLFYGVFTLLIFVGAPFHLGSVVSNEALASIGESCDPGALLCRGLYGLSPMISLLLERLSPLNLYVFLSIVFFAGFMGWKYFQTGETSARVQVRPWYYGAFFVLSIWLVFTSLSMSATNGVSVRRLVEPNSLVYPNVGAYALQTLEENFDSLHDAGCLTKTNEQFNGTDVYEMSALCAQGSFFTRVLAPLVFLFVLVLNFLILGGGILSLLRLKISNTLVRSAMSVGLGALGITVILWLLGVLSYHIQSLEFYTAFSGWLLLGAVPILGYQSVIDWYRKVTEVTDEVEIKWWSPRLFLLWFLLSYLALNYIGVVRPFPIGWDDLGSYLNRPRLLVSYGHFVFSMAQFQWEYLTSLGYLLFGYESFTGATVSMLINWLAGALAVFSVYVFGSTFLGKGRGVLAATLYYTLPMVGHFSFADMKIDNAVFTISALSILAVFYALFKEEDTSLRTKILWFVVAGLLSGYAFAIKATALMVFAALGVITLGVSLHWLTSLGAFFISIYVFANGAINFKAVAERIAGESTAFSLTGFLMGSVVIGIALIAAGMLLRRDRIKSTFVCIGVFVGTFILCIAPWMTHNNMLHGKSLLSFTMGAPNTFAPIMDIRGNFDNSLGKYTVRTLPDSLAIDPDHAACQKSGKKEELDRYWGFRNGWSHYVSLPWRILMNFDSGGYYVTTAAALGLVPLLLLLPFFWRRKEGQWARWLWIGSMYILLQWVFMANGIIWYGIGMFFGFAILLELLLEKSPDLPNRIAVSTLIVLSLLVALGMRMWQFDSQKNLFEYALGKATPELMLQRTVPHYEGVAEAIIDRYENKDNKFPELTDRPYVYRIGTFIPYFIPRNLEVIGRTDHQLDGFNCIYQEKDPQLTVERMKALGFNSIIFDTNAATIEKDPNGSLHKKVESFVEFVNNPESGLDIVFSDKAAGIAFILIP